MDFGSFAVLGYCFSFEIRIGNRSIYESSFGTFVASSQKEFAEGILDVMRSNQEKYPGSVQKVISQSLVRLN